MNRDTIRDKLIHILENKVLQYPVPSLAEDEPLGEEGLGLDSLSFLKMLSEIEAGFGVSIDDEHWDYKMLNTVKKMVEYLEALLEAE